MRLDQCEIDRWQADGVIDASQAEALHRRYSQREDGFPWTVAVLACLGAGISGLGVILLMPYNWQAIQKCPRHPSS